MLRDREAAFSVRFVKIKNPSSDRDATFKCKSGSLGLEKLIIRSSATTASMKVSLACSARAA